ncbi:FHA domain-containing protein [Bifidobacterium samirii]|uniref:Fimv n=1 Tax=Bifidobacterium samirii TaxID=2306974 RepID=A0A430FE29_9BIFI|nr:FHA domain-containing protein [Bifidobacterium samirii]RSX51021.1 fimv [Bifidobacterium samirii]
MSDVQRSRKWLVRIKGCDQVSVRPTESLEIGRKPIRPIADTGTPRLEVPDPTRSMSKRHAVLSVGEQGGASVRDLDSTNGTYLVREDGTLIRLPEGVDFPLPSIAVRLQFGDVPVDMIGVDDPDPQPKPAPVADLFDYALGGQSKAEPDAADLSVDDILDLRAGEPTSMFNASTVTSRAAERRLAALRSFPPIRDGLAAPSFDDADDDPIVDSMPLKVGGPKDESPRDLFADAMSDSAEEPAVMRAGTPYLPPVLPSVSATAQPAAVQPEHAAEPSFAVSEPVIAPTPADAAAWGGTSIWRLAGADTAAEATDAPVAAEPPVATEPAVEAPADEAAEPASDMQPTDDPQPTVVDEQGDTRTVPIDRADASDPVADGIRADWNDAAAESVADAAAPVVADVAAETTSEPVDAPADDAAAEPQDAFAVAASVVVDPFSMDAATDASVPESADAAVADTAAAFADMRASDGPAPDETGTYEPVFEPGSVFERVARGGFRAPEPTIEVDGMTSDDAKRTNDYTVQFAMARHPQLLPFLAMNPSLYDDLYAWLAAQGNSDIDAALAANPGYREYRDMVGK